MSNEICGVISMSGLNMAPLACAFKPEHEGDHSWATLPTFGPQDPATQLAEVERLIKSHQEKTNYFQGFGSAAERVKSVLRTYEDKAVSALRDTKRFRDDMHSYFRALVIVLEMTGQASTHAEKGARLRGAIELLEQMIERLRRNDLETVFSHSHWRDAFASDWPTRRLMDRVHELEAEVKELKEPLAPQTDGEVPDGIIPW